MRKAEPLRLVDEVRHSDLVTQPGQPFRAILRRAQEERTVLLFGRCRREQVSGVAEVPVLGEAPASVDLVAYPATAGHLPPCLLLRAGDEQFAADRELDGRRQTVLLPLLGEDGRKSPQ